MKLYSLRGIFPDIKNHIYRFQSNRLFSDTKHCERNITSTKYYSYMLSQIQRGYFYEANDEELYILKMESEDFEYIGLIAKLYIEEIKNTLYLHEDTINIKVQDYVNDLLKYNILTSPLTLSHNHSIKIDKYLKNLIKIPYDIEMQDGTNIYKIWKLKNIKKIQDLFANEVKYLFLADGHHRMESLKKLQKKFLHAYIVSNKYLKSRDIFRIYENKDEKEINEYIQVLIKQYNLKKCTNSYVADRNLINVPALIYNNEVFLFESKVINLQTFLKRIYEYMSGNQQNNFTNYSQRPPSDKISNRLCIRIPKVDVNLIAQESTKFPPHSSYFEPKIPDGLLSLLLG